MKVSLDYGRGGLDVSIPNGLNPTLIRKRAVPVLADPKHSLEAALDTPVDALPLETLARGRRSACIVICDITRPVPNGLFLSTLLNRLVAAGIPEAAITILVATGLHRPNEGAELEELLGDPSISARVRVVNHDARDDSAHIDLGPTPTRATPVLLDRTFMQSDLKIVTGLVEPHFMAGYSGGRKVIAPGIAHHTTIRTFHSAAFMEDPAAIQCNLKANPLHEEQLEIVAKVGEVYALNTVLDEQRQLTFINFGEIIRSHELAVNFVEQSSKVQLPQRFQTVLSSAAGYPLDKTYYQTVKSMVTPMGIMAPNAHLIVASDCSEGLGSAEFAASQRRLVEQGPDGFLSSLLNKPLADVDEWQTEMQLKPMRDATISLFSEGLPAADRALTGVDIIESIEDTLAQRLQDIGEHDIAVIPEGPYVVPVAP